MHEENTEEEWSFPGRKKALGKFFHQMSARPDGSAAAATCVVTLKTTECPAAPTIHSLGQQEKAE